MKSLLTLTFFLASLAAATARNDGYPLGWIYIPTAELDCDRSLTRCDIDAATVEAHSRPDKHSPVVATLKGGGRALVQDNVPYKWDFMVLSCSVVRNDDGSLSCKGE
jgi:hypothetical protein